LPNNIDSTPMIATWLSSAAREVVNKTSIMQQNNASQRTNNTAKYAQIRTANMGRTVGSNRFAQMYGGGGGFGGLNNTVTQPNFYSPFLTPSSFQIPNTRKEIYLWSNWWRNNEPKVAAGINFYTNFPFNGWKLECKSGVIKDYFEKLIEKLNFQKWLPMISGSYHLYGDAFVMTEIDCPVCHGLMIDEKTGEPCEHKGATWKSMSMLNPDSVQITPGFMSSEPLYSYIPNDREIKVVQDRQPQELFDAIPDQVKNLILRKQPIKLNPISIHHFKHAADPWSDYGTSIVKPLFVVLAYKDKLRQAQWLIAERYIIPTKIVTVGDEKRPASQADLDSVQDQLSAVANDPNLTLVVPHAFKYEFVGAQGGILQVSPEFELLDQELLDGLMLNKALLNGEGPAYGNAQVGLISMNERLETWRREVAQWIEQKIFKKEAEWHEFYATGEGGQQELIYPTIKFDDLKLKDNTGTLQMMVTAQQQGAISAETLVEIGFGLNWDQEVERLRFEQGMNFINSSDVMGTDMNIGFGGVSGNGFGAGLNQPLTPGAEGAPGTPPAPGAEGAPPEGGAPGTTPPPPPGPTADTIYKQYRFAAQLMNDIAYNQKSFESFREEQFISEVDRELNKKLVVSGRAWAGEIPEDLPKVQPWKWNGLGVPVNGHSDREIKTAKMKSKAPPVHGYTGLEKKLYNIVMSMSPPVAFYAQYEAGPGSSYVLDGAFPAIKLAVEADGEIWHNNPNKIQEDRKRDLSLAQQGWTILRFQDKEIEKQPRDVAMVIQQAMQKLLGVYSGNQQMV